MVLVMILGVFLVPTTKISASTSSGVIDIATMDNSEKDELLKYINIEVEKQTNMNSEQKSIFKQALLDFFDSSSNSFQDPEALDKAVNSKNNVRTARAAHGWISVNVMASAINVALGLVTGGSISSYVRKKGFIASAVALQSRLAATMRFKQLTAVIKGLSGALMKVADPGKAIAQGLDRIDKIPNNGWIELT